MKKTFLLLALFTASPVLFFFGLMLLLTFSFRVQLPNGAVLGTKAVAYAALPTTETEFTQTVVAKDARVETVRQFLKKYGSPLEPHAQYIVDLAEAYGLDYRLVPAIAMQESNLCKKIASGADNNCWGLGIYGKKRLSFDSLPDGIEAVTKTLAKYKSEGLETPEQIQKRYTPSNEGSWAFSVNHFMDAIPQI